MKIAIFAAVTLLLSGCMEEINKPFAQLTIADLLRLMGQLAGIAITVWLAWKLFEWLREQLPRRLAAWRVESQYISTPVRRGFILIVIMVLTAIGVSVCTLIANKQ